MIHYQSMLKKYTYHSMVLCLLGKISARSQEWIFSADNDYFMTGHYYYEALKAEFDTEIHSDKCE